MGTPIIVPKYGTFLHIVTDYENGLFYEADNKLDLARKLNEIYDDKLHKKLVLGVTSNPEKHIRSGAVNYGKTVLKVIEACDENFRHR